jgi:hypothetical protein
VPANKIHLTAELLAKCLKGLFHYPRTEWWIQNSLVLKMACAARHRIGLNEWHCHRQLSLPENSQRTHLQIRKTEKP